MEQALTPPYRKQIHVIAKGTDVDIKGMNEIMAEQVKAPCLSCKERGMDAIENVDVSLIMVRWIDSGNIMIDL